MVARVTLSSSHPVQPVSVLLLLASFFIRYYEVTEHKSSSSNVVKEVYIKYQC